MEVDEVPELTSDEAAEHRHEELMGGVAKMISALSAEKKDAALQSLMLKNVEALRAINSKLSELTIPKQDIKVETNQEAVVKSVNDMAAGLKNSIDILAQALLKVESPVVEEKKEKKQYEFIIERDLNNRFSKIIAKEK